MDILQEFSKIAFFFLDIKSIIVVLDLHLKINTKTYGIYFIHSFLINWKYVGQDKTHEIEKHPPAYTGFHGSDFPVDLPLLQYY